MSHSRKYTSKYDQTTRTTKYRRPTKREQRELDRITDNLIALEYRAPAAPNQLI
ncbi:hypothetical protein SEA_HOLLOW_97 [Gordonia phage Hollow]|nr:hypothetical protein SEA_HOLLOW_97 [Gordonia phage Hollow]